MHTKLWGDDPWLSIDPESVLRDGEGYIQHRDMGKQFLGIHKANLSR